MWLPYKEVYSGVLNSHILSEHWTHFVNCQTSDIVPVLTPRLLQDLRSSSFQGIK